MKKWALLLLPSFLTAFQEKPWYPCFLEFETRPSYEYNVFSTVDNATIQPPSTVRTHILTGNLNTTYPDDWNWEMELALSSATPVSWGYRSFGLSGRKLWLDDICGDCISLSTGLTYVDASARMRRSLSTPYHGRANFEAHVSIGKEWARGPYWIFRTYGVAAIGQATSGFPWLRGDLYLEFNHDDTHRLSVSANSLIGLGNRTTVPTPFRGWGSIAHRSIDLGIKYAYHTTCYGSFEFEYRYRPYARSYPEKVNFLILTYALPFCPF